MLDARMGHQGNPMRRPRDPEAFSNASEGSEPADHRVTATDNAKVKPPLHEGPERIVPRDAGDGT